MINISFYNNAKDNQGSTITVRAAIDLIKGNSLEQTTINYRKLYDEVMPPLTAVKKEISDFQAKHPDIVKKYKRYVALVKKDREQAKIFEFTEDEKPLIKEHVRLTKLKKELQGRIDDFKTSMFPAVSWFGLLSVRLAEKLKAYSGLAVIDIDKLDIDRLNGLKRLLANDKYVFFMFVSPSGHGLKIIIKIPNDAAKHLDTFNSLVAYFKSEYAVTVDISGKDVSRLCFLCYDAHAYHNDDSSVFDIIMDGGADAGPAVPVYEEKKFTKKQTTDLTNCESEIERVVSFTNNLQQLNDGNRNNWAYLFARNCNRKGIDKDDCLNYVTGEMPDKDERELKATVYGAYSRNTGEWASFAKQSKKASAPPAAQKSSGPVQKQPSQQPPPPPQNNTEETIQFWKEYTDKEGIKRYSLDYIQYFDFLESQGYYRLPLLDGTYELVNIDKNIIKPITPVHIQDTLNSWCKENNELEVLSMMRKGAKNYFAGNQFVNLKYKNIILERDTATHAYFYHSNCVVEVSADGITTHPYDSKQNYLWNSSIINRPFEKQEIFFPSFPDGGRYDYTKTDCEMAQFLMKVSSNPNTNEVDNETADLRFHAHCSAIGFMLHGHKAQDGKAVIAVDHKMPADKMEQNGGTGKSIVGGSFQHIKKATTIDGREFKEDYPFRFDMLETDTQIIVMGDCKPTLDFGTFFVPITGDFTYNRRNVGYRKIPYADSPKFWFDTNFTFKGDGPSFRRRQHVIEFDDYYNEEFNPRDDFGHFLFTGWDARQWNLFYNFYYQCVQQYLGEGLMKYPGGHYIERKLVIDCPQEFVDWADGLKTHTDDGMQLPQAVSNLPKNVKLRKLNLYQDWCAEAKKWNMTNITANQFTRWIKKYCQTRNNLELTIKKSGGTEFYWILDGTKNKEAVLNQQQEISF